MTRFSLIHAVLLYQVTKSFSFSPRAFSAKNECFLSKERVVKHSGEELSHFPLFMGRAAAVRAQTKGKTDLKKAKTNAVFGKRIIMAVKQGGSADKNANRMLNDVIKQAKTNNVPVENIERAIKKASESNTANFSESTFEAYGYGGASFVINVLSDNANRANADVKSAVGKSNGKLAESGSVLFMYERKGKLVVNGVVDELELMDAAIEAGCDDMELVEGEAEGTTVVYTNPKEASSMLEALKSIGHDEVEMSLTDISKAPVECSVEDFEKNMNIIEALEELDDVDNVVHNMSN